MIYLEQFRFPSVHKEEMCVHDVWNKESSYFHQSIYPFRILSDAGLNVLDFDEITILYGGNGSGKSTALNVISNAIHASRKAPYNRTTWFDKYIKLCQYTTEQHWNGEEFDINGVRSTKFDIADVAHVITSDDIFKSTIEMRAKSEQMLQKSLILADAAINVKYNPLLDEDGNPKLDDRFRRLDFETGENVSEFLNRGKMRKQSINQYLNGKLGALERGHSNGEMGMMYLADGITEDGLYILDEPENSMSSEFQIKLAEIIKYSARYCNSQFIIATHSPFLLSIPNAKIYNLDAMPAQVDQWWNLDCMKLYANLFEQYREYFITK